MHCYLLMWSLRQSFECWKNCCRMSNFRIFVIIFFLPQLSFEFWGTFKKNKINSYKLRHPYRSEWCILLLDTIFMSVEKNIKTNIQNSTPNSWFDALLKRHDPHIKLWFEMKSTTQRVGYFNSISGHFFGNYINISHKAEVLTVILMRLTYLNPYLIKNYNTKHNFCHIQFFSIF